MEDLTIEYKIESPPTFKVEKTTKSGFTPKYWVYVVTNNVELPSYEIKSIGQWATLGGNSPTPGRDNTLNLGKKAVEYANSINWGYNNPESFPSGNEPQELKDLIWEFQKEKNIKPFYNFPPKIQGKSYKNQKYPKGGTLKSLYNQDPIAYTFSSIVVDKTTLEPLPEVKVKDLENQKTTSNPDGSFEISGTFSPGKPQRLIFNVKNYGAKDLLITTLNGSIRSDINVIELIPDEKDSSSSILKAQGTSDAERERLTDEEKAEFIEAVATEIIDTIKIRLIPYVILKLLCEPYGVCDPIGLITLAKLAKEKAKDANERRKEKKAEKDAEKELKKIEEEFENEFNEED